jgi:O-antigen biosynthesis protein
VIAPRAALCLARWSSQPIVENGSQHAFLSYPVTPICDSISSALSKALALYPGHDVLLICAAETLPPTFLSRMLSLWNQSPDIEMLSPLIIDNTQWAQAFSETHSHMHYQPSQHRYTKAKHHAGHGSLIRSAAIAKVLNADDENINAARCSCVVFSSNVIDSNAATDEYLNTEIPTVLHVLHSWGGGIECFARDLQRGDAERRHLFLKSHSRNNAPPLGKELCLYSDLDQAPLEQWFFAEPIADTSSESKEEAAVIKQIIDAWGVGAIIVSSLIGHSLDVLKAALPTAIVVHDAYPFWPLLHDQDGSDYSDKHLQSLLEKDHFKSVFSRHDAVYWRRLKDQLVQTILDQNILCVSPSEFSKNRICKIDQRMQNGVWSIIPHGISDELKRDTIFYQNLSEKKLKVVVPGRINGEKGEALLEKLLRDVPENIAFVLLGCSDLAEKFAGPRVETIPHYTQASQVKYMDDIMPDMALLPSTIPETYGYVLSEMLQLGLPVICSDLGAYAERGRLLPGVVLVEPKLEHFKNKLIELRDNPNQLNALRRELPFFSPSLSQMAKAWAAALPVTVPKWQYECVSNLNFENEVTMEAQLLQVSKTLHGVYAQTHQNTAFIEDSQVSINRQQAMLENLLIRQGNAESSLHDKDSRITALVDQFVQMQKDAAQSLKAIDKDRHNMVLALAKQSAALAEHSTELQQVKKERDALLADVAKSLDELAAQKTRLDDLKQQLQAMQAKRGWRFLSLFK